MSTVDPKTQAELLIKKAEAKKAEWSFFDKQCPSLRGPLASCAVCEKCRFWSA